MVSVSVADDQRLKNTTFRYTLASASPNLRDVRADGSDGTSTIQSFVFDSSDSMTVAMRIRRPADPVERSINSLR